MSEQDPVVAETPKKKPGRPKGSRVAKVPREAQAAVQSAGFAPSMEQWGQLIEALRGNKEADIEAAATVNARAMKKALRPENEISPMISVYNPLGETLHPRPKPSHIFKMGPYPIADPGNYDTVMATELALLEQVKPGSYMVTKADGTDVKVLVTCETQADGKPYRTTLFADGTGIRNEDEKNNWGPLLQILTQIVTGEGPAQSFSRYQRLLDAKDIRIAELESKLAASAA